FTRQGFKRAMGDERTQQRRIERVRKFLLGHSNPRLQMFAMLSIAGLAGFSTSVILHWLGLNAMWLRYPIAVGVAYLVFLGQIGIWLSLQRRYSKMRGAPSRPVIRTGGDSAVGDVVYYGSDLVDDD